jgi:hypothetical protein
MSEVDQLMIKQREMLEQDMKHRKYLTNVMVLFWFKLFFFYGFCICYPLLFPDECI